MSPARLSRFRGCKRRVVTPRSLRPQVLNPRGATARSWAASALIRHHSVVLRGGHAASILVKHVEKPTDNGPASSLCCRAADADSLDTIGRHWPRRISHIPPRAGARGYFDGTHRSRAEGGTGLVETRPQSPGAS